MLCRAHQDGGSTFETDGGELCVEAGTLRARVKTKTETPRDLKTEETRNRSVAAPFNSRDALRQPIARDLLNAESAAQNIVASKIDICLCTGPEPQ
jgi:hypothetical protein